jgi:hypothetical protein
MHSDDGVDMSGTGGFMEDFASKLRSPESRSLTEAVAIKLVEDYAEVRAPRGLCA